VGVLSCRTVAPEPLSEGDAGAAERLAQSRMAANLNYRCDDPATHSLTLALALPPLLLYTLGLPLVLAAALFRGLEEGSDAWQVWAFSTAGHRRVAAWWESWVMARKALLAAVAVLLSTGSTQTQLDVHGSNV
jgi:hypothetical protein